MDRRKFIAHSAALASTPLLLSGPAQARTALRVHQVESGTVKIGSELSGYYARPAGRGPFPAVLLFMEAFGLNEHIQDVCKRLASLGYAALAPDFYHGKVFPYAERERAMAQLKTLDDDQVMAEAGQGLAFLAARAEVADGRLGVIGFCMGGRLAFLTNITHGSRLRGAVSFYGGGIAPRQDPLGRKPLLDRVAELRAPALLLYGAKDGSILPDEHARIAEALSAANKRYTLSVFPNAGHAFFNDQRDSYVAQAATEAWQMTLHFLAQHLKA